MRQTLTILGINLGRLVSRPGLALVNILGVASAVAVMISTFPCGPFRCSG